MVGLDKKETELTLLKGMDYTHVCTLSGDKYAGSFTGINYGCNLGVREDSSLANLGQTPNEGMKIIFLSDASNPNSIVDVITDDTTLYAKQIVTE